MTCRDQIGSNDDLRISLSPFCGFRRSLERKVRVRVWHASDAGTMQEDAVRDSVDWEGEKTW